MSDGDPRHRPLSAQATASAAPDRLAQAVRALARGAADRATNDIVAPPPTGDAVAAARDAQADLRARMDALEQQMRDTQTRVNALLFAVITAGVGDMVARAALR